MKNDTEMNDELQPEYDLKRLRIRRLGPGRKSFGGSVVRLEPDVAQVFPDAESVNEALRFLIRVTKDNSSVAGDPKGEVTMPEFRGSSDCVFTKEDKI